MKIAQILILLISIVLESTILPYPLTLSVVIIFSSMRIESADVWAFIGGILLDLFIPRTMGLDSLYFLAVIIIIRRYQKKWHSGQLFFTFFVMLGTLLIYVYLFYRNINPVHFSAILGINLLSSWIAGKSVYRLDNKKRLSM